MAKKPEMPRQWDWASGVPASINRARVDSPLLGREARVALFQDNGSIQLAGAAGPEQVRVTAIGTLPIRTFEELHLAVERASRVKEKTTASLDDGETYEVGHDQLLTLEQAVARNECIVQIVEDRNPWVLVRDGDVRGKMTLRAERSAGLLQVILSLKLLAGTERQLPVEIRAYCNDEPLACLTAAEAHELLYGSDKSKNSRPAPDADRHSFASVSSRDDYRIPTNFGRLQKQLSENGNQRSLHHSAVEPALAVVPGVHYPGPAILGDARALSSLMLQCDTYRPDTPEATGWVLFACPSLNEGGTVTVELDFGDRSTKVAFKIPSP